MKTRRWCIHGVAALFVGLLAVGCSEDSPMSPDSTKTTAATADAADVTEDAADPLFVVTSPGVGDNLPDPSNAAVGPGYCTATRSLSGECEFSNSTGYGFFKQYNVAEASGSGVFDPFVRISANTEQVQGVNTSGRDLVWDENSSPTFTRDLRLDELPQVECPSATGFTAGSTCRELGLDTNQEGGAPPGIWISLDAVQIYVSPNANICDETVCKNGQNQPFNFNPFSESFGLTGGELIWALDGLTSDAQFNGISTSSLIDSGSGRADVLLYLSDDLFAAYPGCDYDQGLGDDCGYYVHVYSHFGSNDINNDGYEEWNVRVLPIVLVDKTAEVVADKRWNWTVDKTPDAEYDLFDGDQIVQEYDVDVDKVDFDYENFRVSGTITITNPDKRDPAYITKITDIFGATDITDQLSCPFPIGEGGVVDPPYELAKNSSIECTYGPIAIGDDFTTETNTATVRLESGGQFEGSADADVADVTVDEEYDECVTLSDNVVASVDDNFCDDGSTSYQWTWSCDADEGANVNIATITGDDSESVLGTDDATVTLNCYDLTVTKDANEAFERQYFWMIDKDANYSVIGPLSSGQSFSVNYSVTVDLDDTTPYTDDDYAVSGTITITNNNPTLAADLTGVTDVVSPAINATVDCSGATSVAAGSYIECTYAADLPDATQRTNTATATMQNKKYFWDDSTPENLGTTDYSGTADVIFGDPTSVVDECINVEDTFPEFAAQNTDVQVCVDDPPPVTLTYTKTFSADDFPDCTESEVPNTATFTTTDTGAQAFDGWVLTVVRDCPTCNLTQGYWKTHNANFWGGAPEDPTWLTLLGDDPGDVPFFGNSFSWFDAMWTAPAGNAYWQLSRQWIAATLNVTAGSDESSVAAELACGEALFNTYSPDEVAMWDNDSGGPLAGCPLTANPTRHDVIMWAAALDGFNNSNHCDDDGLYAADYDDGLPIQ
jgi:hypothetical protein